MSNNNYTIGIKNGNITLFGDIKYISSITLQRSWSLRGLLEIFYLKLISVKITVGSEFIEKRIEKVFGWLGAYLLKLLNPDVLPLPLRTNFYICKEKK